MARSGEIRFHDTGVILLDGELQAKLLTAKDAEERKGRRAKPESQQDMLRIDRMNTVDASVSDS